MLSLQDYYKLLNEFTVNHADTHTQSYNPQIAQKWGGMDNNRNKMNSKATVWGIMITLLTGFHRWLLTILCIVPTNTTIITGHIPILLGTWSISIGNYILSWIHRIEPPISCHLLHTIAGLAPHYWVMHQPICIWGPRQVKRNLCSIGLMCLVEVATITKRWQSEERRNSVDLSVKWVMVKIAVNLKTSIGPTTASATTRPTRARP